MQDPGTLGEAVQNLKDKSYIQRSNPLELTFQGWHWIKADNAAVAVNVFCTSDAFELLFKICLYIERDLLLILIVCEFFERMMKLNSSVGEKCQTCKILQACH